MYELLSDNEEDMMILYIKKNSTAAGIDTSKTNRLLNDTDEKGTIFVLVYLKDVFGLIMLIKSFIEWVFTKLERRRNWPSSLERLVMTLNRNKRYCLLARQNTPSLENVNLATEHILS